MPVTYLDEQEEELPPQSVFTPRNPLATGAVEGLLDNVLGLPNTVTRAGNSLDNFVNAQIQGVLGKGVADFLLPSRAPDEGVLNVPSGRQVLAGGDVLGKALTGDFNVQDNFNQGVQVRDQLQAENPDMFQMGGYLGDALTILTGRAPLVGATRTQYPTAKIGDILAPRIENQLNKVLNPALTGKISRLLGRSGEAATEGAALAVLNDTDPEAAAYYSAGLSAGSNVLMGIAQQTGGSDLLQGKFLKAGGKFAATAIAFGGLVKFADSGLPGDIDSFIGAVESGFDKMVPLMLAGGVAALGGAGRINAQRKMFTGERVTEIAEALTTLPRASLESALVQMVKNEEVKALMDSVSQDPSQFSPDQLSTIQKAFEDGKLEEVAPEILSAPRFIYIDE